MLTLLWILAVLALYVARVYTKRLEIKNEGLLYLTRYHLIRCKRFRVFLHRIYRPDMDRHLHNHPWPNAFSLILRGGYEERWLGEASGGRRRRYAHKAGEIHRLTPDCYHKIELVYPNTWTLFFAGRRSRRWGFLVYSEAEGWQHVDFTKYLRLPYDTDLGD